VDWDTTAKTASFTAVSGNGYFVNTTSSAITLTLPASPSAGDIVAFKDYAFTFATNNLTVDGNGSPIGGVDGTILPTYSTNGTSKTFIYVDGTKGWLVTNESTDTSQESNISFVTATGGTVTCCGDYKIHTFTGPGTFCVSCAGNACGSNRLDYMVIAGGGAGGNGGAPGGNGTGGGGAGGFRESVPSPSAWTASPLASTTGITASVQSYPITVGAGASYVPGAQPSTVPGSASIFSTITSAGGGSGGGSGNGPGGNGGSGGGAVGGSGTPYTGGTGNTPPVSPPQGNNGGNNNPSPGYGSGGGGGATAVGGNASGSNNGTGGNGATTSINGTPTVRAGGGGGGGYAAGSPVGASGGPGGGGPGGPNTGPGTAGTTNTGSGGGGSGSGVCGGGNGGSGIVIIRYKYQ